MDPNPARVGGLTVESVLGTGGTSTVYLAWNGIDHVALKVFESGHPSTSALVHPHIVAVLDRGQTDSGKPWIAMQYVPGGDADTELRAGRMPSDHAVQIIAGVAEALDYAHTCGVLHGDVKPSNFLLAEQDRALLADFGTPPFVENGEVLVSAAYASPEMLRGKAIDGRADVYSLGCSLFRLLTGKPPFFDAVSKDEVVNCHLHRDPPRPTQFAPWLPAAMDDVVAKAMAKDPDKRYQSARALATAAANLRG